MPIARQRPYSPPSDDDRDDDDDQNDDSDQENVAPRPIDADDAIVLSDLVRTGEASRLRRRGAMRIEHQPHPVPAVVLVSPPPAWDDSDSDEQQQTQGAPVPAPPPMRRRVRGARRPVIEDEQLDYVYTLFCGGGDSADAGDYTSTPFTPSILPVYPTTKHTPPRRTTTNTTTSSSGCGALLHIAAAPRFSPHSRTWTARTRAPPGTALVPLDASYFATPTTVREQRSACGCVREGVGCALCGTPLGVRVRTCAGAGHQRGHAKHRDGLARPDGMAYWRSGHAGDEPCTYTYTFFADAVTSSPAYVFPTPAPTPRRHPYPETTEDSLPSAFPVYPTAYYPYAYPLRYPLPQHAVSPTTPTHAARPRHTTVLDRLITASPTPLSDEDRAGAGVVFDADGVPGSPEKTEMVLGPER
ncbi:hypothetical protein H0H81_010475 [Sphagnurus paluster]|uniref:Uncharacterized protein n=1 Tax=Sphagnurus paluster TaxID=117069 RepID=A0A9P7KHU5_9AGAR|nr:hypothetical protein H0H81_010475 [Sphagnurus paluster]